MSKKKIGRIAKKWWGKRPKGKPLAYVDRSGRVLACKARKKTAKRSHEDLGGDRVPAKCLQSRKALQTVLYVTKAGFIVETKSGLRNKKKKRGRPSAKRKTTKRKTAKKATKKKAKKKTTKRAKRSKRSKRRSKR